MSADWVIAAVSLATILIWMGIIVGLFYAHVSECARFRREMLERLERIEMKV